MKKKSAECFHEAPYASGKHTPYFDVYDVLFEQFVGKDITFLEIGVLNGGSLFMWRNFFGPQARIIGVDLNPEAEKWIEHGFEIHIGSQADPHFWSELMLEIGSVDIILDDGGHTFLQQITTSECLLDSVKDNGLLVVEDTHTSYMKGFGDLTASFITYSKNWIDKINSRFGRFHDAQAQEDRRVWSIEFFESIVAFKVNRSAANLRSEKIWNQRPEHMALDFREHPENLTPETKRAREKLLSDSFKIYK
jgi:hypothetical protein